MLDDNCNNNNNNNNNKDNGLDAYRYEKM